jgi:hypothetical protein
MIALHTRIKDLRELLGGKSNPRVFHGDPPAAVLRGIRRFHHNGSAVGRKLDRVVQHVPQHLPQPRGIRLNPPVLRLKVQLKFELLVS